MVKKKNTPESDFLTEESPIKKPYVSVSYTPHQINELRRCASDVIYFIENYVYVVHPTRGNVLFKLYPYQKDIINNIISYKNNALFISRQMGKSACVNAYILWLIIFKSEQTALIVSNIREAAIENVDRIRHSYENLPDWLKPGVIINNRGSMIFDNKSRIISRATTKNSGRGLSPSIVFSDELAFVDPKKQREFWSALSPTLSTGGACIIASTPMNDEDVFAQICAGAADIYDEYGEERPNKVGRNGFKLSKFTWESHPDRDKQWEAEQRSKDGDEFFEREHLCKFITADSTLINPFVLATLKGVEPESMQGKVRWYRKPTPDKSYLIALDPSMGVGRDQAAIQVWQLPEMVQVAEWCHNRTEIPSQVKLIREIAIYILECQRENNGRTGDIYWSVENNNIGEAINIIIKEIGEHNIPGDFLSQKPVKGRVLRRKGFCMSNKMKVEACARFKNLIERNLMTIKSKALISQLKVFVASGASFKGKGSEPDDLVMSTLLVVKMLERIMNIDDDIREQFEEGVEDATAQRMPLWGAFS